MSWLGLPAMERYKNIYLYDIKLNHAQVLANTTSGSYGVYSVDDDCTQCPFKLMLTLLPGSEHQWQVDTIKSSTWRIMSNGFHTYMNRNNMNGLICHLQPNLREFGVYNLNLGTCNLEELVPPVYTYLPLLLFLLTLLNMGIVYTLIRMALDYSKRKLCPKEQGICLNLQLMQPLTERSLYFFRGILLMLLIFTTSGAGGYSTLTMDYGKITLAESLYLSFIWSLGFKIPATIDQAMQRGDGKSRVFLDILKRTSILITTGVMIDATISKRVHPEIELWSPLQKAGLAYFFAAVSYAFTSKKISTPSENIFIKMMACALSLIWCWIIGIFFFTAQLIGMSTVLSFNLHPAPFFTSVVSVDQSDMISQVTNIQPDNMRDYVNKLFVSETEFIYLNSYYGFSKGLLGISSSILQCFVGLKAGTIYLQYKMHGDRIRLWCIYGVIYILFSVCLILMSLKTFNLWPVASIFLISSLSFFLFASLYAVTEKSNAFTNSTINSFGVTSIIILCGHLVFSKSAPFSWDTVFRNHLVYLLHNAWVVALWLIVGVYVAKRGFRLSV